MANEIATAANLNGSSGMSASMDSFAQNMPAMNSFMQGFKWGYQGTQATIGPFLAFYKAKKEKQVMRAKAESAAVAAKLATTAAETVLRNSDREYAAYSAQSASRKSKQKVSMAANGVVVGVGSSAEVLASGDIATRTNLDQIALNGITQSFGYRWQAVSAKQTEMSYRSAASSISPGKSALAFALKSAAEMGSSFGSSGSSSIGGMFSGLGGK